MKNKRSKAPIAFYYKDSKSPFDILYIDMFSSPQFLELKRTEQLFYFICRVQSRSSESRRCVYKHIVADSVNPFVDADMRNDEEKKDMIQNTVSQKLKDNYFVFPAKHLERYGYSRSQGSKLLKALSEKGFIETVENNQERHKVNVYKFSSSWKTKIRVPDRKQNDVYVSPQETKIKNVISQETENP